VSRRGDQLVATNRRARHDYHILDTWECGIVLEGSEVKSLRDGHATIRDAYARVEDGEVWLHSMHIPPYAFSRADLDTDRKRKLLLHHKEILELARGTEQKGHTLVPLRVYFKDGRAKLELGLARGKRAYDKRQALAKRDADREAERALKGQRD
jgi:SsrA-binding protein